MRTQLFAVGLLAALCTACPPPEVDPDGGTDGGDGGAPDASFALYLVEGDAGSEDKAFNAVALANDGVGIAYFHRTGYVQQPDGGAIAQYELRYREWRDGTLSAIERPIGTFPDAGVQRIAGLGMAVLANGEPAVSYLGGYEGPPAMAFWFQNDLHLSYRSGAQWNTTVVVQLSNEAPSPSPVSTNGEVVGLDSAIVVNGAEVYVAYRDVHNGQFDTQDYRGSDLELATGTVTGFPTHEVVVDADGMTVGKQGFGGDLQLVFVGGQPAILSTQKQQTWDDPGRNAFFFRRTGTIWSNEINAAGMALANTQLGPSLAYSPAVGYAAAVLNISSAGDELLYLHSTDGVTWDVPYPVLNAGSSGWYPSLAIHPTTNEVQVAYYHCDTVRRGSADACRPSVDELRIARRLSPTMWRDTVIDPAGAWAPKLLFLTSNKRAVVYRDPRDYSLKLAVEP